jgi:2-iminobutanoate/2-iminopropanoate deaminase
MAAKKTTTKKSATKKSAAKKTVKKKAVSKKTGSKKPATKAAAPVGPYTPVVRAGDWVIVSGQLGLKDGVMQKGVSAQTAQAVVNLKARLAEAGVTMDTFATFNEAYVAGFGKSRPARSTIGVAALPMGGQVEIEAWAYKPLR